MLSDEQRAANIAAYEEQRAQAMREQEAHAAKMEALRAEAELLITSYSSNAELIEISKRPPVVLLYIDGDQYGANPVTFAGAGEPYIVVFDGSRYDKYNWDEGSDPPRVTHEDDLKNLEGDAYDTLLEWVKQAEKEIGIDDEEEEDDD